MRKQKTSWLLGMVLVALILLSGCRLDRERYPRIESSSLEFEKQTVEFVLPEDADEIIVNAVNAFGEKLLELSDGAVELKIISAGSAPTAACSLALASGEDLITVDKRMRFLKMPELFSDRESFLTIVGAGNGIVRGNEQLEQALGGEIIGCFYGGAVGYLGRGRIYDEIGPAYSNLGILDDLQGVEYYYEAITDVETRIIVQQTGEGLMELLESGAIKYAEFAIHDYENYYVPLTAKYYENTQHRFYGWWMLLRGEPADDLRALLMQTTAYIVPLQNAERIAFEEKTLDRMTSSLEVRSEQFPVLERLSSRYYQENHDRLIDADIWKKLSPLLYAQG